MFEFGQSVTAGAGLPNGGATFRDWNDFAKAIQTTSYETDVSQLTGMSALRVQSLETTLRAIVAQQKHFKILRALKRAPTVSTVHEWMVQTSLGGQIDGMFNSETGVINSDVGAYERKVMTIKYLMTQAQVSHVVSQQKLVGAQARARENQNALTRISAAVNRGIFHANSGVSPMQFDGIFGQLDDWRSGENVRNVNGSSDANGIAMMLFELKAEAQQRGNFGDPDTIWTDSFVQNDFDTNLMPQYRIFLDNNPGSVNYGAPVKAIRTSAGDITFDHDIFIDNHANTQSPYITQGKVPDSAPGTPTLAVAVSAAAVTGSEVADGRQGTYYFAVAAIDQNGVEGIPSTQASGAVILNGTATLTITPNADHKQTGYAIYCSKKDASSPALKELRRVTKIAAASNRTDDTTYTFDLSDIPGGSHIALIQQEPECIQFVQLMPATQFPLYPTNAAVIPWAVLLYGALQLGIPQRHFHIKNYLPSNAGWKPF